MAKKLLGSKPYLYPMPLTLIGAVVNGKPNYLPAAFVGIVNMRPAMVACGLNPGHYTCRGMEEKKAFSINIPSEELMVQADYCGLYSGNNTDKSGIFTTFYGKLQVPLIVECPVNIECQLRQVIPLGVDSLYLGEIAEIHCDEEAMANGNPDPAKIRPFMFTFPDNGYYALGKKIGEAWEVGKGYTKKP